MENRKDFLKTAALAISGFVFAPLITKSQPQKTVSMENPKLDAALVQDFVANCHGNFEKVKELYNKEPLLIFSSHDWGNGDFENGIEAAGHMGNKEIAHFLLEKGARMNFFTMCMLGKFEAVSYLLSQFPYLLNAKGPHGFTPLHHAKQGGAEAARIMELLQSSGATETQIKL